MQLTLDPGDGVEVGNLHESLDAGANAMAHARGNRPPHVPVLPPKDPTISVGLLGTVQMDWHNNGRGAWCADGIKRRGGSAWDCLDCCRKQLTSGMLVMSRPPEPGEGGTTPPPHPNTPSPVGGGVTMPPMPIYDGGLLVGRSTCGRFERRKYSLLPSDRENMFEWPHSDWLFWRLWKKAFK